MTSRICCWWCCGSCRCRGRFRRRGHRGGSRGFASWIIRRLRYANRTVLCIGADKIIYDAAVLSFAEIADKYIGAGIRSRVVKGHAAVFVSGLLVDIIQVILSENAV